MITCNSLKVGYIDPILQCEQISFTTGELYCLIGKNGAGKSTFLKTLMGDIAPLSGKITIANRPLSLIEHNEKAKLIAFVPSKFDGIPFLTSYEFIAKGRIPYTNFFGNLSLKDKEIINEAVEFTKVGYLLDKETTLLSDGERQLISITRALAQDTPYILLDEPTSFLDPENKLKLFSLLSKISKSKNKLCLISTHDIEFSKLFCTNYLVISQKNKTITLEKFSNDSSNMDIYKKGFEEAYLFLTQRTDNPLDFG